MGILAVPPYTWSFQQASVRPGTSGTVTVTVTNNEDNGGERNFKICINPTSEDQSYLTGSCDGTTISTLSFGQTASVTLTYSIDNSAPTPSSAPATISIYYEYSASFNTWPSNTVSSDVTAQISGISVKDEANQQITSVGTQVSSAQNTLTTAQGALTTAQNMITQAQQQNKDTSTAGSDLSSAQASYSSAQSSLSAAQTQYSQAQSYYNTNDYTDSLNSISAASSNVQSASTLANSANQYALQAQIDVTNAPCVSGYVLQSGTCVQQSNSQPNSNPANPQPNNPVNPISQPNNTALLVVAVIVVLGIIGIWYYNNQKKKKHRQHEGK